MAKQQLEIPGTERKKIKALEDAAEELRSVRTQRMALTASEKKAATKLLELMRKHELTTYVYESSDTDEESGEPLEFDVLLDGEPKVKVRKHKEIAADPDDDPDVD